LCAIGIPLFIHDAGVAKQFLPGVLCNRVRLDACGILLSLHMGLDVTAFARFSDEAGVYFFSFIGLA
jgi:hypothetical protein